MTFILTLLLGASIYLGPLADPPSTSAEDLSYDELLNRGVDAFYKSHWDEADEIFNRMKREKPDDPTPHFFSSMMSFWEYFLIEPSAGHAEDFLRQSEEAVKLSKKKLDSSPNDTTMVLMLSGLHGYRSLVAAGESNYRVALQSGLTGFNYTRQLLRIDSDRPDARIGRGMFYYMVGTIPSGMRWASNMAGIRGDMEQGFEELKMAAESDSYVRNDARMILMYLYDRESRYDEAINYAEKLTSDFPENVIFTYKKAQIFENAGNKEKAASLYAEIVKQDHSRLNEVTEKSREKLKELEKLSLIH
ncbi:MAG: tetratricopeptide repeat protein [Balneolaceae bacterium]|nr:tetratricopeptide repeat protein [Balneolaceae bacterium]MCH8548640.1 tetratricopeptide repeat protein [Balneolaceae bacterium]